MKRIIILGLICTMALGSMGCGLPIKVTFGDSATKTESTAKAEDKNSTEEDRNTKEEESTYDSYERLANNNSSSETTSKSTGSTSLASLATIYVPDNGRTFMIPSIAKMPEGYTAEDIVRKIISESNGAFDNKAKVIDVHSSGSITFVNMNADFNSPEVTAMKAYCIINTLCANSNLNVKKVVFLINSHNVDYIGGYDNRVGRTEDKSYIKG